MSPQPDGIDMDGSEDNRILRVGVAFTAVAIAVVALRGRIPGVDAVPPEQSPADGVATMVTLVALGLVSAAILAITLISALRARRARRTLTIYRTGRQRLSRRQAALGAVVAVIAVLAALGALMAIRGPTLPDRAEPVPQRTAEQRTDDRTTDAARRPPARDDPARPVPTGPIMAVAGLLVALAVGGTLLLAARSPRVVVESSPDRADSTRTIADDEPAALVRAATLGLAEVAEPGRDPRAAIIACYAAMERGLAEEPDVAPLPSDTPSEVLNRAVVRGALHTEGPGASLVGLFAEARFSPHQMTEAHRESAVTWLRILLDDLGGRR